MAVFARLGRRNLRFFGGGETAGDRWEEKEKKRIVDYLHEPDDDDDAGGGEEMRAGKRKRRELSLSLPLSASSPNTSSTGGSSYSPRSLLSRWLLPLQKPSPSGGGEGGGGGGVGEVGSGVGCLLRFPRYSRRNTKKKKKKGKEKEVVGDGPGSGGSSTKLSVSSGEKPEGISFNLGMGLGLVFLLTKCASEFKRMTKMQAELEILLKEIKDEVQNNDVIYTFLESSNGVAFSAPDCSGDVSTSKAIPLQSRVASFHQEGAECATESDEKSTIYADKRRLKMDQLEAKLEVEIERMQLNLEGEDSSVLLGQHKIVLTGESSDSSGSFSINVGQDIEPKKENNGESSGVSALELERRLHELLHTKQQERIAELEYVLECTKRKLVEKEIEICWLRESASLASPHKDEKNPESIKKSSSFALDHLSC
ncbi:protein POLAR LOCALIZATION DURING ASYMMETRIC DIVISION AND REDISTRIBUTION-like [Phoenix dactylifera]|uniref:Protein POLAR LOCALIZATION DURING ASYMMETRIC DIVISION AND REDISTRIBUTION-like n=1 Tax=Phoenix dactylifera TaxID=42345 RepID=A0A8B7C316_PHODC|nr:protein POLAR LOCALIZATION DURING ASYMMETRIC DIVISION AND REDISTRIBUTION-like [Phoenix dactylifera]